MRSHAAAVVLNGEDVRVQVGNPASAFDGEIEETNCLANHRLNLRPKEDG